MPIKSEILHAHRLLYMDHSGFITASDVSDNYHRFLSMPGAHKVCLALVDLRRIKGLRAYFDGMGAVADMISSDGDDRTDPWQIAIVTDNTGHLPLLLEYADRVGRSGGTRCAVLPTMAAAADWLGLPRDVIAGIETNRTQSAL
ncbi:hypothetical protein KUH32_07120 [Thalassococcus sp. CAU 1522]|uniref:Uncharacterized protein n=1 Tax=Thalassococcus arenae TaxID=2851652 RepID=A0ABS6N686_9RHOB|nr:hypothetical protein [Thalassococcus arenae]MBV2359538.1 hypothetical protein [Thalassococcus arenae]